MDKKLKTMWLLTAILIALFITSASYKFSEEKALRMLQQISVEKELTDEK